MSVQKSANISNTFIGLPIEKIEGDSIERDLNIVEEK